MHYYLYKITNKINQKIYIGVHSTSNLEDGYMGSGKYLKRAIKKHGIENFEKEILETFDNSEDMYNAEKLLVTKEFVSNPNTYNLKIGGEGGWDHISNRADFRLICSKGVVESNKRRDTTNVSRSLSRTMLQQFKSGVRKANPDFKNAFKGKKHTDKTKKIISEKAKVRNIGEGNSQFGTMWITDGSSNKKIMRTDTIPEGWRKGRKL